MHALVAAWLALVASLSRAVLVYAILDDFMSDLTTTLQA